MLKIEDMVVNQPFLDFQRMLTKAKQLEAVVVKAEIIEKLDTVPNMVVEEAEGVALATLAQELCME